MGARSFSIPLSVIILVLLTGGLLITGYGLYGLTMSSGGRLHWRWTNPYLLIFLAMGLLNAGAGYWCGPRKAGAIVAAVLLAALGAAVPAAVVCALALSAFALGRLLLRNPETPASDCLLAGVVAFGTVLGLLAQLPVNNAGTWGLLFALPLVAGRRHARTLWSWKFQQKPSSIHLYLLHCAISAAVLLHVLVGLMPEIGHDSLAMHMFVPSFIAQHQAWHFDAGTYVWAVMPMFVDWLYTAGYLFAGETGARLVNVGCILLLAVLVQRLALWAGACRVGASWAVLLLLVTPLSFLESSSLFIEGMWSVLAAGGTLSLLRLLTKSGNAKTNLLLGSMLLGGSLAAKAVSFIIIPVLALVLLAGLRRWFTRDLLPVAGLALLLFLVTAATPYVTAYVLTGNPVFPFFNAYFQSPIYPPVNFKSAVFSNGVAWDTLYRITFDSGKYLEAKDGAAGFQWLLLVLPAAITLTLARHRRALLLGLICMGWFWLTFEQTAYLRYVFPSFALACVLAGVLLSVAKQAGRWAWRASIVVALVTLALNILYFDSGTYYGKIDLHVITDPREKTAYLNRRLPLRSAVKLVNELNLRFAPVAFFSAPLITGLKADALLTNWYNPRFQNAAVTAGSADELGRLLAREGVDFLVVDYNWKHNRFYLQASEVGDEIAKMGSVSVYRLYDRYRYSKELLPSIDFETGWQLTPGAYRLSAGGLRVNASSPAYSVVKVQAGKEYRYIAEAGCVAGPAKGRLQVNWLGPGGKRVHADIEIFNCTPRAKNYRMDVIAPSAAQQAIVYASGHEAAPVIFKKISLRNRLFNGHRGE
jgi:hypothetical protein